jgi:hypothetical protein
MAEAAAKPPGLVARPAFVGWRRCANGVWEVGGVGPSVAFILANYGSGLVVLPYGIRPKEGSKCPS